MVNKDLGGKVYCFGKGGTNMFLKLINSRTKIINQAKSPAIERILTIIKEV